MIINIVDEMMGAGKTSAAINYINSHQENKYIYITPYLTEVERINRECGFNFPIKYTQQTPKTVDLKILLNKGANIVTTHAMFHCFDDEIIDLCYSQGYILIMDEVTDVVEPYMMCKKDLEILLKDFASPDDSGILHWVADEHTEKFSEERRLCDLGCLALYSDVAMVWMFPVKIFNAFHESYILTYLFDAQVQKYYYDYYGMEYRHLYVDGDAKDNYHFTTEPNNTRHKYQYNKLINIIQDEKLNMIGDAETALSKTWYVRNSDNVLLSTLKKNVYNFFNNRMVKPVRPGVFITPTSSDGIWTTFADYRKSISGRGYAKSFLSSNARATNEYKDRSVVAYLVNKYFNPVIKNFFVSKGIAVDEDKFATSEMLQFIWRSAIRDGNPITIYIPSSRMRRLLLSWIEENS